MLFLSSICLKVQFFVIGFDACMNEGYIRSISDCAVFYYCQKSIDGIFDRIKMECGSGLAYDPVLQICNYRQQVDCSNIISKHNY